MRYYATKEEAESIPDKKTSNCCGEEDSGINGDASFEDYGLCPACNDNCCYGYYDENGWEWFKEKNRFYNFMDDDEEEAQAERKEKIDSLRRFS